MFLVKILKIWEWVFGLFLGFFCCCWWWFLIFRVRICELKWREHNLFIFFLLVGKKPQNIFALNLHFPFHALTVTEWMPIAENLFTLRLNSYKFKYRNRVEVPELINRNILVLTGCPEKQEYYHCYCKIPHPKLFLELIASQINLSYGTETWFLYFNPPCSNNSPLWLLLRFFFFYEYSSSWNSELHMKHAEVGQWAVQKMISANSWDGI